MKRSEILEGKTYTDGSRERKVIAKGAYNAHHGVDVTYVYPEYPDNEMYCTLNAFARWAKSEVVDK